jgi:glucose/arabinose dehydrogenase
MSVLPNGDILIAEMWSGKIKYFDAATSSVSDLGAIDVYRDGSGSEGAGIENGLLGMAADPNFAVNKWIYVFFARKLSEPAHTAGDGGIKEHEHMLRRYTVAGGMITSPKDMLSFPRQSARHAAGGMAFDKATGDLLLTTGDDTYPGGAQTIYGGRNEASDFMNSLRSSGNTNDLRGKTLRIHPLPFPDSETPGMGAGKAYSIPAGNLFPVGTDKTRPEIYTMGHRNPYRIKVDSVSGAGMIGEVGPDARVSDPAKGTIGNDEFNLVLRAANYGWPFANANNLMYTAIAGEAYPVGTKFEADNLKNLSRLNTGLQDLPPATPAVAYYNNSQNAAEPFTAVNDNKTPGSTAIAGPYYRYDPKSSAKGRLPAYFHGKWIVGDWSRNRIWAIELDAANAVKKLDRVYNSGKVIDMDIGPHGELYVLEYGYSATGDYQGDLNSGAVYRLEYTGTQYDTSACPATYVHPSRSGVTGLAGSPAMSPGRTAPRMIRLGAARQLTAPAGMAQGILFNLKGEKFWQGRVINGRLPLPGQAREALAFLRFQP